MLLRIVLAASAVMALSPPYTTPAPDIECRVSDPATACPTYANCYGKDGCETSGCPGGCAPTSSCTMGSPSRTCEDPYNICTPFYSTCTTDGCFGACIYTRTDLNCPTDSTCSPTSPCTTAGCGGQCIETPGPTPTSLEPCIIGRRWGRKACTEPGDWTCTPTSPCTHRGCGGLCLSISTPEPYVGCTLTEAPTPSGKPCKIDDPASSCDQTPMSSCHGVPGCSTPGCEGTCTARENCDIIPENMTGGGHFHYCPSGEFCSSHSGTGYCHTVPVTPTPEPTPNCKIDDPVSSCNQTPMSSCHGISGCTTPGCEGTCTARENCDIIPETMTGGGHFHYCPEGEFCSSHSETGYCHTIPPSPTGGTDTCITPVVTVTTTLTISSASTHVPLGPECTIGGEGCDGRCYTCIDFSGACTTEGCVAECIGLPCATTFTEDDGPSATAADKLKRAPAVTTRTEPSALTRTFDCLVSVTGRCGVMEQCEPWYGTCCDSLNCPGTCVDLGVAPPTGTAVPRKGKREEEEEEHAVTTPTEPSALTRTYDCLVSVTGYCGVMEQCEPWYGECCDGLHCPGRCVGLGGTGTACPTAVEVTTTVTVYTIVA